MKWDNSNDNPIAYTSEDRRWGLVKVSSRSWELHFLNNGQSIKKVADFGYSEEVPFDVANSCVDDYNKKRRSSRWSESTIGTRRPGEEGPGGGRPIPMQTQKRRRI